MQTHRVALLPGSTRRASIHRQLARALAPLLDERGVATDCIDLSEYPMPIYQGDWEDENGQPTAARQLTERLRSVDGLIFVTPEHNGGPSALLKNTVDWITRVDRAVFKTLVIGLAAASPGSRGGANGLRAMRHIVDHMRLQAPETMLSIPNAGEAFSVTADGVLFARHEDRSNAERFVIDYVSVLTGDHSITS